MTNQLSYRFFVVFLLYTTFTNCLDVTASLFFGVWKLLSLILSLCFSCNLLAVLFMPEYEATVDTACDVLKANLVGKEFLFKGTVRSDENGLTENRCHWRGFF
jgi:hypothetical protein